MRVLAALYSTLDMGAALAKEGDMAVANSVTVMNRCLYMEVLFGDAAGRGWVGAGRSKLPALVRIGIVGQRGRRVGAATN